MSAFVLPAELPAHKISCCVYCSLNKSPHLFSTISTRYIPLFHYSVLYPLLCWAFSPYYTLQVHIFLYSTYSLLHTINKNMCLYCIVSFQCLSAMNLNSQYFFCFEYLLYISSIYSRNVLLRIKLKQIVIWTWRVNYDNLNQIQSNI